MPQKTPFRTTDAFSIGPHVVAARTLDGPPISRRTLSSVLHAFGPEYPLATKGLATVTKRNRQPMPSPGFAPGTPPVFFPFGAPMALESATYLSGLVASNPSAGDPITQSDDHLRLIKSALLATFPSVTGAVTSTQAQLNYGVVPTGGIILWAGSIVSIPTGWGLCDGSSYTKTDGSGSIASPNLRDRFVVGAGTSYAVAATGGATTATGTSGNNTVITVGAAGGHTPAGTVGDTTLTTAQIPAHTHGGLNSTSVVPNNGSLPGVNAAGTGSAVITSSTGGGGSHTHSFTGTAVADHTHTLSTHTHSTTVATVPPYYALAYIMKL